MAYREILLKCLSKTLRIFRLVHIKLDLDIFLFLLSLLVTVILQRLENHSEINIEIFYSKSSDLNVSAVRRQQHDA